MKGFTGESLTSARKRVKRMVLTGGFTPFVVTQYAGSGQAAKRKKGMRRAQEAAKRRKGKRCTH